MFGLGAVRRAFDAEVVCVKCRLPGLHPKSPPISRQAVGSMVGVVLSHHVDRANFIPHLADFPSCLRAVSGFNFNCLCFCFYVVKVSPSFHNNNF